MSSIGSSGSGIKARVRHALIALKGKDGSYGDFSLTGKGELYVKDEQLSEIKTLLEEIRDSLKED